MPEKLNSGHGGFLDMETAIRRYVPACPVTLLVIVWASDYLGKCPWMRQVLCPGVVSV